MSGVLFHTNNRFLLVKVWNQETTLVHLHDIFLNIAGRKREFVIVLGRKFLTVRFTYRLPEKVWEHKL